MKELLDLLILKAKAQKEYDVMAEDMKNHKNFAKADEYLDKAIQIERELQECKRDLLIILNNPINANAN